MIDGLKINAHQSGSNMDIYSEQGTKVRFLNEHGYDNQREEARKLLKSFNVLTVKNIIIESWSSSVEFEELPNKYFNTVMFEEIE